MIDTFNLPDEKWTNCSKCNKEIYYIDLKNNMCNTCDNLETLKLRDKKCQKCQKYQDNLKDGYCVSCLKVCSEQLKAKCIVEYSKIGKPYSYQGKYFSMKDSYNDHYCGNSCYPDNTKCPNLINSLRWITLCFCCVDNHKSNPQRYRCKFCGLSYATTIPFSHIMKQYTIPYCKECASLLYRTRKDY